MDGARVDPLERLLRRLALSDHVVSGSVLTGNGSTDRFPDLDSKTRALVRLGALISVGACTTSFRQAVEQAHCTGATDEEILGVLSAVAPAVGLARTVAVAPGLALALGYDVEDDLT